MNILIEAGPGSGKTTTLVKAFEYILTGSYSFSPTQEQVNICHLLRNHFQNYITPQNAVFIAFNTSTKDYLQTQIPSTTKAYTFNGLGQSVLQRKYKFQTPNSSRGELLLQHLLGKDLKHLPFKERQEAWLTLRYITALKEELLPVEQKSFEFISSKYGLNPLPQKLFDVQFIKNLMLLMIKPNNQTTQIPNCIEFIDQLWMALPLLTEPIYQLAFIDEAQDLSVLRLEFAKRVAKHCVFCGDTYQAINAFAGADYQAFDKIRSICAYTMPLKTSFRLPPNHIAYANTIRPARIQPFKTQDGPIETLALAELAARIRSLKQFAEDQSTSIQSNVELAQTLFSNIIKGFDLNDITEFNIPFPQEGIDLSRYLLIARTNSQLFQVGITLFKQGIRCSIVKRSGDDNIEDILKYYLKSLPQDLDALINKCLEDQHKADNLPYRQGIMLYEKASCILSLARESNTRSDIDRLLSLLCTDQPSCPRLSTIHKAKGLEAPFVFILFPPIKHPKATLPQEIEQETNLEFVSETRSSFYKGYVT